MSNFLSLPQKLTLKHPAIVAYFTPFDVTKYSKEQTALLPIPFPDSLGRAVNKRQAEYFAARYCAHFALKDLNAASLLVGTGDKRQPLWPKTKQGQEIVGSITHSNDSAYCIAAHKDIISHLGIDVEHHMTEQLASDLKRTLVNEVEEQRINALPWRFAEGLTLVFSAKETIFKTLFYDVGEYFGFEAAEFLGLNTETGIAEFALTRQLAPHWQEGAVLDINFQRFESHLLTYHFKVV